MAELSEHEHQPKRAAVCVDGVCNRRDELVSFPLFEPATRSQVDIVPPNRIPARSYVIPSAVEGFRKYGTRHTNSERSFDFAQDDNGGILVSPFEVIGAPRHDAQMDLGPHPVSSY